MLGYLFINFSTPPSAVDNIGPSGRFPVVFIVEEIDTCRDCCYYDHSDYDVDSNPAFTEM